ncbi:MAG: hypothetical protein AAF656_03975 [Planctomycetota bacterium]
MTEPTPVEPIEESPVAVMPIDDGPVCPLCDAEITDPSAERCPTCGYGFASGGVQLGYAHANPDGPSWFVETADHAFAAGWKTSLRALVPSLFWRDIPPTIKPRRQRLNRFIVLGSFWAVLLMLATGMVVETTIEFIDDLALGYTWADAIGYAQPLRDWAWVIERELLGSWRSAVVMVLIWPWLNYAGLLVFQQTLRRAGVDRGHVARVAFYAADPRLLLPVLLVVTTFFWGPTVARLLFPFVPFNPFSAAVLILWWLITTRRMGRGMSMYLRLPQPWVTTFLVQAMIAFIAVLALLNL